MIKEIVKNYKQLRQPCSKVEPTEDIKSIIQDLKDTLESTKGQGVGLSANQIGVQKKICLIKIPYLDKNNKLAYEEIILINPKIIEKSRPVPVKEKCLSFQGLEVTVKRYVFIIVEYENEDRKIELKPMQDYTAIAVQHECSHLSGRTIIEDKYLNRNSCNRHK
jgi:peptide deformylase